MMERNCTNLPPIRSTHIVDRVGGGDSFIGGLIPMVCSPTRDDLQAALDFAVGPLLA